MKEFSKLDKAIIGNVSEKIKGMNDLEIVYEFSKERKNFYDNFEIELVVAPKNKTYDINKLNEIIDSIADKEKYAEKYYFDSFKLNDSYVLIHPGQIEIIKEICSYDTKFKFNDEKISVLMKKDSIKNKIESVVKIYVYPDLSIAKKDIPDFTSTYKGIKMKLEVGKVKEHQTNKKEKEKQVQSEEDDFLNRTCSCS
jgi:hypothetical protein